ncbi:MAG TPA: glycosyltransferase family 4 protein [Candidatus Saccharimonadales bacterium]|nr:glycosyltransferase family 4 protein [Candidatus Saccharimonadales bacterium]
MTSKLKIGLVFDDSLDKPDGVQQYVLTLGEWLRGEGHDVHYLVGETKRQDIKQLHSLSRNMQVRFNQNRMAMPLPARLKPIRALLQKEQFDVLHVQVPFSPLLAGRIIASAGPDTAVTGMFHVAPHSGLVFAANRALGLAVRRSLKRFDAMLANTPPTAAFAKRTYGLDCQVLPLPLKLDAFVGARPLATLKSRKNVLFLGRLVERKGCRYLLQAVAYAQSHNQWPKDAQVLVCGGGPLEAELRAYAAAHHLQDIVQFTGYLTEEEKPNYLAAADVAVYPSTGGESFGVVLLEAMAASRGMVLGGNNPGYASVLAAHPEALFDPKDIPAFAEKLTTALASDPARFAAHDWQQRYVAQFSTDKVGAQTVAVFRQALQSRRG